MFTPEEAKRRKLESNRISHKKWREKPENKERIREMKRLWNLNNRDRVRSNWLRWFKNNEEKFKRMSAEKYKVFCKTERGKKLMALYQKTYAKKYPEKRNARLIVFRAVKSGKIKKLPCQVCGESRVEGHHPDYSKPLSVKWLCKKHHIAEHKK